MLENFIKIFVQENGLFYGCTYPFINDLGMYQPANNEKKLIEKDVYGVLPYMPPEVLRGCRYLFIWNNNK